MEETVVNEDSAAVAEAPEAAPAEEDAAGQEVEEKDPAPRKSGVTKRIDELVKLREEARRDAEYWRKIALDRIEAGKKDGAAEPGNGKPEAAKFKTYDEYVEALTDYKLGERARLDAERGRLADEGRRLAEKVAKAEEKYPDFREVAMNPELPITPAMYDALIDSPNGADIAYYLGKFPDEAGRIASMSPIAAVKEIGRLEARFSGAAARRVSQAPAPPRTISGNDGGPEKSPAEMSMEEYRAWRRAK